MNPVAAYSPDYATARRRFREAAARLGWALESYPVGGEDLTLDVALSPGHADQALVLSSGVHGVEGFFGSAVQVGLMQQWADRERQFSPLRCIFLHALNPFGFARLRRFDGDNVDLNRNFLLPGEAYRGVPRRYAKLDGLLNPARPVSAWDPFLLKALWTIGKYGVPALRQAIAGGQYEFPHGIFFGGRGPSPVNRVVSEHFGRWLRGTQDVVHFDFHTGLGKWGTCRLLIDYALTPQQRDRLTGWFGANSFEVCQPKEGISYDARGGFGRWCVHHSPAARYLFACAEFGTYAPLRMLCALRAENQAHHWDRPETSATRRAKRRLAESFCPASAAWRERVLLHSFDLVERAERGLELSRVAPAA